MRAPAQLNLSMVSAIASCVSNKLAFILDHTVIKMICSLVGIFSFAVLNLFQEPYMLVSKYLKFEMK